VQQVKANARNTAATLTNIVKQELAVYQEQKHRQLAQAAAIHGAATKSFTCGGCPTQAPQHKPNRKARKVVKSVSTELPSHN
jgi:hypothetical protein